MCTLQYLLLLLLSYFSRVRLCATPWRQPTRLPCPWDSPGKNTGGLPFPSPVHESEKWKWSRSAVSDSSRPHGLQPTRLLSPWDFPGKSTEVGCHCLLWKNIFKCAQISQTEISGNSGLSQTCMSKSGHFSVYSHIWDYRNIFKRIISLSKESMKI